MRSYGVALPLGHGDAEASASASTLSRSRHESDSATYATANGPVVTPVAVAAPSTTPLLSDRNAAESSAAGARWLARASALPESNSPGPIRTNTRR